MLSVLALPQSCATCSWGGRHWLPGISWTISVGGQGRNHVLLWLVLSVWGRSCAVHLEVIRFWVGRHWLAAVRPKGWSPSFHSMEEINVFPNATAWPSYTTDSQETHALSIKTKILPYSVGQEALNSSGLLADFFSQSVSLIKTQVELQPG